jgi:hypothetical protein
MLTPQRGIAGELYPSGDEANLGRADEGRWPDPGSARPKAAMPASRDFR